MKTKTLLLAMLLATATGFAQNNPINFESGGFGAGWTWTVFENAANPAVEIIANPNQSGINTSATVAKYTALQAGQPWAGTESAHGSADLGPFVLDQTNSTIKIMVWKPIISDVGIKLVAATGWAQAEIKVSNTVVNQWEELTFDFSAYTNPPESEGQLDQIVVFPDFNTSGRTQDNVIYFDNITFGPAGTTGDGPVTAAPTPARNSADVVSIFSDAYTNVSGTNFNPSWGQSTVVSTVEISGNATLKYANFNYQGTEFASALDVTGMEMLHLDMWTGDATTVNIYAISPGPAETAYQLSVTPNQWVSYDIPLTAFSDVNLSDVIQFKFDGGNSNVTLYLDNIYFYKDGELAGESGPRNPINFESGGYGADWTWTVFENAANPPVEVIANPAQSGINTSAMVAKFTALQAGQPWAGTESAHGDTDLGEFVLDETNSTIKIMVWKPVISDVGIKLVASTGWAQAEIKVANTVVNQWEELTFDFSSYMNPPASEGKLDQIVVFPDFNTSGRTQDNVIYFDNITFGPAGTTGPGDGPVTAAPTPARNSADVISLFSSAYDDVTVDTWRTGWSSAVLTDETVDGVPVKKYSSLDFVGIETVNNQLNVTDMTHFSLDVWSADFTFFGVKLVDFGADGAFGGGDDTEHQINFDAPTQGVWVTLSIPLMDFAGLTGKSNIAQLILVGQPSGNTTVYVDNVYFFNDNPTSVERPASRPDEFALYQNYPNPFNPSTSISYSIAESGNVKVEVYNMMGQLVQTLVDGVKSAGTHTVTFDATGIASGIYLYRLTSGNQILVNKMTLVK